MPGALAIVNVQPFFNARDPLELKLSKTGYLNSVGGYASATVTIDTTGSIALGQYILFSWPQGSSRIDTSGGPSDTSHLNISDTGFAATALIANPQLNRDYVVTQQYFDGTYIYVTLVARKRGTQYNLTVTNSISIYSVAINNTTDDVVNADDQLNFYIDVLSDIFYDPVRERYDDLVAIGNQDPDSNQIIYTFYELPALVLGSLGADTYFPFVKAWYNSKNWCYVGLIPFTSDVESDQLVIQPIPGNIFIPVGVYVINSSKFPVYGAGYVFLTRTPSDYLISMDQPIFLTLYLSTAASTYTMRATVTFDDTTTAQVNMDFVPILNGALVTWPAGYRQLGFDVSNPGQNPVKIDIVVFQDGYPYAQGITYYYDLRYSQYERYILLQNSYGGYDTLRCRGVNEYSTKYTRQTAAVVRTSETTPDRGTIQMTYNEEERIWTMRTGWLLSLNELEWIRELLMTGYAAEIMLSEALYTPPSGYTPWAAPLQSIIIQQDSVRQYQEDEGMWAVEWKMKYADDKSVAQDLSALPARYTDCDLRFSVQVHSLSSSCKIAVTVDNTDVVVLFNGQQYSLNQYPFPDTSENITIQIIGYHVTECYIEFQHAVCDIAVTKLRTPSLQDLRLINCHTIYCDYLLSRLPTLALTNLELESGNSDLPIDQIAMTMAASFDTFGVLAVLILSNTVPSASGLAAFSYLSGSGVYAFYY